MEKPQHIAVAGRPIKVQKWQIREEDIAVTTIASGDRSATDILALIGRGSAAIGWEGMDVTEAAVQLTDHWVTGEGATAVHRISFVMSADSFPRLRPRISIEERLEIVLAELDRQRLQIADLEERMQIIEEIVPDY